MRFFQNYSIKIERVYDSATPLLGVQVEKTISKDTCTPIFGAALLTTPQEWKPPQCPSLDEQEMTWPMYKMDYYSAIRKGDGEGQRSLVC